ncbi:MAG: nitroreductase family protein [Clostridium sp.]|jgi:nitroreductase|uniref:nitroreductase family protein n=1 Tax=Clostridium sp. (strain MSTE9) TaxID=1105031 RepID=UPI00026F3563|nr:nitroreductase family protein [Clostridium sp. MSTE9]EJF42303.1 nitroreductase family protein [Clostridium sp. MSTE9]MBS5781290.1 nitroreductase family protein [Clostridium sp.]
MNPVMENILTRRSIRSYEERQIPAESLDQILLAGTYAPSGRSLQTWKFTAVQNPQVLARINAALREALRTVSVGPDTHPYVARLKPKAEREDSEFLFHAPTYVIVSNDRQNVNALADSAVAMENMMLAAHSFGIGSCWLNHLPGLTHHPVILSLMAELDIPDHHDIYGTLALGWPKKSSPAAGPRKDAIHIIR